MLGSNSKVSIGGDLQLTIKKSCSPGSEDVLCTENHQSNCLPILPKPDYKWLSHASLAAALKSHLCCNFVIFCPSKLLKVFYNIIVAYDFVKLSLFRQVAHRDWLFVTKKLPDMIIDCFSLALSTDMQDLKKVVLSRQSLLKKGQPCHFFQLLPLKDGYLHLQPSRNPVHDPRGQRPFRKKRPPVKNYIGTWPDSTGVTPAEPELQIPETEPSQRR